MPNLITRLNKSGILYTPLYFDEVTYSSNKLSTGAVYSNLFDEVSIYNINTPTINSGLLCYYNFNGDANDSSNNGINLVISGQNYNSAPPKIGTNSARFRGGDGISYNSDLWDIYGNSSQSYTVAFWYNSQQSNDLFIAGAGFSAMGIAIQQVGGKIISYIPYGSYKNTTMITSITNAVIGTWIHIAVVVNQINKMHYLYINGTLEASNNFSANWPFQSPVQYGNYVGFAVGGSATYPGSYFGNGAEYGGACYIDTFGLWSRALNPQEAFILYNNNIGQEFPISANTTIIKQINNSIFLNGFFQEVNFNVTPIPTPTPTPTPTPPPPTPTAG